MPRSKPDRNGPGSSEERHAILVDLRRGTQQEVVRLYFELRLTGRAHCLFTAPLAMNPVAAARANLQRSKTNAWLVRQLLAYCLVSSIQQPWE